MSSSPVFTEIC